MSDLYKANGEHIMSIMTTYPSASSTTLICHICGHCGGNHASDRCPYVKAIEYYENGQIKRVEFFPRPSSEPAATITVSSCFTRDSDALIRELYYIGGAGSE